MFKKERRKLNRVRACRGFTLIEVIIVLAILAILAAFLIPSFSGYIDKANERSSVSDCRNFVTAAQVLASEKYADRTLEDSSEGVEAASGEFIKECFVLAELDDGGAIPEKHFVKMTLSAKGKITELVYTDGYYTVTYSGGDFNAEEGAGISANTAVIA